MSVSVIILMALSLALGLLVQYLWVTNQRLGAALLDTYEWIDEIATALEDPDEGAGNVKLDKLVKEKPGAV